jgi:hypothetical protein
MTAMTAPPRATHPDTPGRAGRRLLRDRARRSGAERPTIALVVNVVDEPVEHLANAPTVLPCRHVVVRNPRRTIALVWLGVLVLLLGSPIAGALFGVVGVVLALVASLLSFVQAARVQATRRVGGSVVLETGALRIAGGTEKEDAVIPLSAIVAGYQTRSDRTAVLHLRDGAQVVVHLDKDDPARVLSHAGVAVAQRALTLPLRGQFGAFTIGFVAVWPLLFSWWAVAAALQHVLSSVGYLGALALTALSTALVVRRFGFPRVIVGTDGIRVVGRLLPRFLPYENIKGVELVPPGYPHGKPSIRVLRRKGGPIELPTIAAPRDRVEGLARRIDEAVRAHAAGGARGLDALARGGRSAAEWKDDVRRLALAPPTFRDQAHGVDDYERVLGDAAAAPDQRVGAALALRAIDPEEGPARIRVAAGASADEALRDLLEAAAEGEIDDALLARAASRRARR